MNRVNRKSAGRNRMAAPIGVIIAILAGIGLITVISLSVNFTVRILDNTSEKERFERIIAPVLMFDPVPFERITDADNDMMLLPSALWAALYSENRDRYAHIGADYLLMPASDLDVAAARLFGPEVQLEHNSFGDFDVFYYYDEYTKTYEVPTSGQISLYTPRVETITRKGDRYILLVGYIPPLNAWTANFYDESSERLPDKYMIYELRKAGSDYQIVAVRMPDK